MSSRNGVINLNLRLVVVVEVAVYELIQGHKGKEVRECDVGWRCETMEIFGNVFSHMANVSHLHL